MACDVVGLRARGGLDGPGGREASSDRGASGSYSGRCLKMAFHDVSLGAGDHGNVGAYRPSHGDRSPSARALAMVSGDSLLVARPAATPAGPTPRLAARPSVRTDSRRAAGAGWAPTRLAKGRDAGGRSRSRQARFSPYPAPGLKPDLLRTVLRQRLAASRGGAEAPPRA